MQVIYCYEHLKLSAGKYFIQARADLEFHMGSSNYHTLEYTL